MISVNIMIFISTQTGSYLSFFLEIRRLVFEPKLTVHSPTPSQAFLEVYL